MISNAGRSEENYTYVMKDKLESKTTPLDNLWASKNKFLSEDGYWYVRLSDVCTEYNESNSLDYGG